MLDARYRAAVHKPNAFKVGVVGCGQMGHAIAGELLRRGCTVLMYDQNEYTRAAALQTVKAMLFKHVRDGYLVQKDIKELMGRASVSENLKNLFEESPNLVIESVVERIDIKRDIFKQMADILEELKVSPDTITLASSTMSLSIQEIINKVPLQYHVSCIGMRFLLPVWFVDDVELVVVSESIPSVENMLTQLSFKPFYYIPGGNRKNLTIAENDWYQSRQRKRSQKRAW